MKPEVKSHSRQLCHSQVIYSIANEADGTEKQLVLPTSMETNCKSLLSPYSVKTFKVRLKSAAQPASEPEYVNLPLNYDRKCASFNEFRGEANFESGYSYAAELLPDSIFADQIPFRLGEKETFNGMTCKGGHNLSARRT